MYGSTDRKAGSNRANEFRCFIIWFGFDWIDLASTKNAHV